MALKQDGVHFAICPKQSNKIEGFVLNRVYLFIYLFIDLYNVQGREQ